MEPYFPEYPDTVDFSDYPEQNPNYLAPIGIAGGAGLALKAAKTKAKLKGLKLLAVPAGIALLGGIAALASGVIPPAVIGGINLPFQVSQMHKRAPYPKLPKLEQFLVNLLGTSVKYM